MLAHLLRQSRALLVAATLASTVSGLCAVLLIGRVNAALNAPDAVARAALAPGFVALALLAMLGHMTSVLLFERLSQRVHAWLRGFVAARVLRTDLRRLEELGGPRLHSALAEHSGKVAEAFSSLPAIVMNAVVVTASLVYLAWLSPRAFAMAVAVIGLGSLGYHFAHLRAIAHLDRAAREQDRLFGHFRALVEGAKELRLHRAKRERFERDVLGGSIEAVRADRTRGMSIFAVSTAWGAFLIHGFIGLVLFALVDDGPDRLRVMTGFALVFVYMTPALEAVLLNLPRLDLALASAARIEEITRDLDQHAAPGAESPPPAPAPLHPLVLAGVTHSYYHEARDEMFTLGPIDLAFAPGEIVFLVGGNGSGKTTLAKLLVGLYRPTAGRIVVGGQPVDSTQLDRYRQHFSAVFSDYFLFDSLLDVPSAELDARGNRLLARLNLAHKVRLDHGAFTTRDLSTGQRKRLALVVACLEERPFIVFDEWAADQDPVFKEVFYRELLPELKARGRTVLVISHDDRYFDLADRLLHLENGRLAPNAQASSGAVATAAGHPAGGCKSL
ncbi:cyclic peptide export ABC transporter [Derxia lacustris]|uniref:cyclic peptide export ABC transporter n=1 Tax=Derxia lacustris TaxID=764842 RepID=UPI000A16EEDE|nr:cyclic peptide export ABC transporter [Derxia lacustris]